MWFRRIGLFLAVNLLVMVTISMIVHFLGLENFLTQRGVDYGSLMIFCLVWGMGGSFLTLMISRWSAKTMMGVQVLDPENPGGAEERWLVQTVHNLAQRAGLTTMPEVGIYESPDPNAFATGPDKHHALVAVSTGLFNAMEREEIEAVLGHEMTHITNGDMVTLTLIQGVINAFVMFLAYAVSIALTRGSDNDRREGSPMAQFFLRMVLEMVFGILGMIPVMAFSRWREYRADAGGAGLTSRQQMANGLRALQRYIHQPKPSEPASIAAFKISAPGGSLFASHPPLEKRIQRLEAGGMTDPGF
ncbi:MAG TPA: protease HtpX [bacterium]|nr:protease HtpX [bacterium]